MTNELNIKALSEEFDAMLDSLTQEEVALWQENDRLRLVNCATVPFLPHN